jgi:hypothetical protein
MHPDHTIKPRRPARDYLLRLLAGSRMILADYESAAAGDDNGLSPLPPTREQTRVLISDISRALDQDARAKHLRSRSKGKR